MQQWNERALTCNADALRLLAEIKEAERRVKLAKAAIALFGTVINEDGTREYAAREVEQEKVLNDREVYRALFDLVGDSADEAVTVSKARVLDVLKAHGIGKADTDVWIRRLKDSGAIGYVKSSRTGWKNL